MAVGKLEDNLRGENSGGNSLSVIMRDMAEVVKHALSPDMAGKEREIPSPSAVSCRRHAAPSGRQDSPRAGHQQYLRKYKKICQINNFEVLEGQGV